MLNGRNEIKMIWLMALLIAGAGAWYGGWHPLSYICLLGFAISVMHYVDDLQQPADQIASGLELTLQYTSKAPLYIASIAALVGGTVQMHWLTALGMAGWIFFFLRWLKRLERNLNLIQHQLNQHKLPSLEQNAAEHISSAQQPALASASPKVQAQSSPSLAAQLEIWLFQGNPVLKAAIAVLVIGIVLLLRFATEHWQLSLAFKLGIVALISAAVSALGVYLLPKNRGFALALQGLGLAALCLTLFFAYYNQVIASLLTASLCFICILLPAVWLSLKQQSIELALMAMLIAYIAPFTLPVRSATATEFVAYYLLINLAVAVLSTLRPWKILNQIAFLMTLAVGGSYAFYHGHEQERSALTALVLAHAAVFIWLGFRFSQLLAKDDLQQFQLKPVLDVALIFGAPIAGFSCLYLMYFDETVRQAGFSLGFAALFLGLYRLSKRNRAVGMISQSYFSLMLIFLALIPPILLPKQWSVCGWAVEGALIFVFALYQQSAVSRYLALSLLGVAGVASLYYWATLTEFPREMYWTLCISYFATVLIANSFTPLRKQLSSSTIGFQCMQMLFATVMLFVLLLDQIDSPNQVFWCLLLTVLVYSILNEWLLRRGAGWSWLLPKWIGLMPVYALALYITLDLSHNGIMIWPHALDRLLFAVSGALLTMLWLRPMLGVREEREWVSLGVLSSLAMTSLTLIPSMPYISVAVLPLAFALWCCRASEQSAWKMFWQARSVLVITLIWMICSQVFSQQAFQLYWLPVLNPFDLTSIAILAGFVWMLNQQVKSGLDRSMGAVLMVLGLLWLSSYVVLRALHVYWGTPYNEWSLWENAAVQLSFTFLWVGLAFISMTIAAKRKLRPLWILGGSILVLVTLKLVLFDLSHIGTLTRVISFLGAGFVMLLIAYIAPMPEANTALGLPEKMPPDSGK